MALRIPDIPVVQRKACCLASMVVLSLMFYQPALAEVEPADAAEAETELAESNEPPKAVSSILLTSEYRFLAPEGPAAAAVPYGRLTSGVHGGLSAATLGSDVKLKINGMFLHEDDYESELAFDYGGLVRFQASSEAIWHNLLREQVNPGTQVQLQEDDRGVTYGARTSITQARARLKLGNNPFHLNLGYWELKREGDEQLRFSDHYWSGTTTVISQSNRVDRITREGSLGLDAHLGFVDFSYGFRLRDFINRAADPKYRFNNDVRFEDDTIGALVPGIHAHNVIPDSRTTSHTFKLFTDMSGGLVGSAVYTLTERENRGGHGEAVPSERPSDIIHLAAGDFSYTPSKFYSLALKYRHQEIDRTTPVSVYYPFATTPTRLVNPAPSTSRDVVTASAIFRPYPKMIYRLEYNAELESRDNVRNAQAPLDAIDAQHSDSRLTHTGKTSLYWRPFNSIKLNVSYSYVACDNPAYRSSFSDRHAGKVLLTYANPGKWGVASSYLVQHENGQSSVQVRPPSDLVITPPAAPLFHALPRQSRSNSANAGVWFSPLERLTITTSYSFLQAKVDQASLLTELHSNALASTSYRSTSHIYSVDANYAATEQLDLSLALQQVFSRASFDVPPISPFSAIDEFGVTTNYNSNGISRLSRLDTTETGLSARADWRVTAHLGCAIDYSFRVYDSGNAAYDGTLHATMLSLKARW